MSFKYKNVGVLLGQNGNGDQTIKEQFCHGII